MSKHYRKSQMEIMGLVIIVILISIGMLFVLQAMLKPSTSAKKTYTSAQLASNTLNSLVQTETGCYTDMTTLIKDCAEFEQINCPGNLNSCEFAEIEIKRILKTTLQEWNKAYRFEIYIPAYNEQIINDSYGRCIRNIKSELYPLSAAGTTLFIKLDICD